MNCLSKLTKTKSEDKPSAPSAAITRTLVPSNLSKAQFKPMQKLTLSSSLLTGTMLIHKQATLTIWSTTTSLSQSMIAVPLLIFGPVFRLRTMELLKFGVTFSHINISPRRSTAHHFEQVVIFIANYHLIKC